MVHPVSDKKSPPQRTGEGTEKDECPIDILEYLEQGIALVDSSFNVVLENRRFENLFHKCFGTDRSAVLSEYINRMGRRKRAVMRIQHNQDSQFFLMIKEVTTDKNTFYLLSLNKRRLRKMDLFKILRSEYKISLNEFKIITYLSKGFSNGEIARLAHLSTCNVKYHLSHLYDTFYVSNRTEFLNKVKEIENGMF